LAESVIGMANLDDFRPQPRASVKTHFTSFVSGNHFLTPADFAAIYGLQLLYDAGFDGTGQTIAIVGQTAIVTSDLDHFRAASGLVANDPTQILVPGSGNSTIFSSDLVETDLDLEWSGGVAKGATIKFVYVGEDPNFSVWDSLQYAVDNNVAPFISTSYGFCEQGLPGGFPAIVQGWAQQGITQGQTIVAASGDQGAADCEGSGATTAAHGLAVDVPASIPEVTGMGGTAFSADAPTCSTACAPGNNPPYWLGAGTSADLIASAQQYIPESVWNDTALAGQLSATGGGLSTIFTKPSWQAGAGVPDDPHRAVPDVALTSTPNHDGYLFCSQIVNVDSQPSCTNGFRDSQNNLDIVGGTSAASPTFAAILALVNQSLGNAPPVGLAPINPRLYQLASSFPEVFNDVTSGNNKVPCTSGTTDCPSGTTQIGFSAGTGYDEVTGLGSVNGALLAQDIGAEGFTLSPNAASYQVAQGSNTTATITLTPVNGWPGGSVTYTCSDNVSESTCTGPSGAIDSSQAASFSITTKAPTARLDRPFDRSVKVFYATLVPGLLGIVFIAGSRGRRLRGVRFLGMILVLGFSTMWMGSCGGSSSGGTKDPGTPAGTYSITVTGTSGSLKSSASFLLVVVP